MKTEITYSFPTLIRLLLIDGICLLTLLPILPLQGQNKDSIPHEGPLLIYKSPKYTIEDEGTFPHYTNIKRSTLPYDNFNPKVLCMERTKDETLLTIISHIPYDWSWYHFSHNDMIVDCKTGNQYKLRGVKGNLPIDTCFFVRHQQGDVVEFTLIFPPLPKSVKFINYIQIPYETRVNSGESTRLYHLNVKALLRNKESYRPRPKGKIIE